MERRNQEVRREAEEIWCQPNTHAVDQCVNCKFFVNFVPFVVLIVFPRGGSASSVHREPLGRVFRPEGAR